MKSISLLVLFLAGSTVAAPQGMLGGLLAGVLNAGYGKVADVPGAAPRKVELASRTAQVPNAKTVKIRYGPYKVPNMSKKSITGESGTLYNYPHVSVEKPFTGEGVLFGISAGLEYPDGKDANTNSGMWLHHVSAVVSLQSLGGFADYRTDGCIHSRPSAHGSYLREQDIVATYGDRIRCWQF
jgi:hypothetical protein